jgi:hypothetical protein
MEILTEKSNNKRVMKKMGAWYGLNKTTPEAWFNRWECFLSDLFVELGFEKTSPSEIATPRGQDWNLDLTFHHAQIGEIVIVLRRKRKQQGGVLILTSLISRHEIQTKISGNSPSTSLNNKYTQRMCRQSVGDQILEWIRQDWVKRV